MSDLADLLEARVEELVQRWMGAVQRDVGPKGVSDVDLRDHIPGLLAELIVALRGGPPHKVDELTEAHGRQRYRLGFDVESMVREHDLLRESIFDLIEETNCPVPLSEVRILADFIAATIAEGVEEHVRRARSEARLAEFFELSPDLLAIASARDGLFVSVNPAMTELLGLSEAQLLARPFLSIVHPDDLAASEEVVARLAGGEVVVDFEHRIMCADGGHRWVAWHAASRPEEGVLYGVGRDITERRRAEEERAQLIARERGLREQIEIERQKLLRLFTDAPIAVCVLEGAHFTFTFANDAYRAVVGGRAVVGKPLFEAVPELAGQGFETMLERVVATGEVVEGNEAPVRLARNGQEETAYLNFVYAPRRDAEGHVDGVLVFASDVTAQVRARRAAETATAELEAIFESLPDAVYVGNENGITRANQSALTMLGYDNLSELNRHIGTLAEEIQTRRADTGEVLGVEDQAFTKALQGKPDIQEVRVRDVKTGAERVLRSSCAPIRVGGEVVGAVAINTDITERSAARERAEELAREAKERAAFEQYLIGIVSHDLRNPLNVILLGAGALLHQKDLSDRNRKAIARMQVSAERATRMIRDLLDFTKARLGGGITVEVGLLDVHALVRQAVEEVEAAHPGRDVEVRSYGDGQLQADGDRLSQVVHNLVGNALSYSPEGAPVDVVTRGENGDVVLCVHNGGPPIPPERLPHLFEPLQRATTTGTRSHRSLGLGLYIVQHIVRAHGGSVEVRSSEEEGTTFSVRLPRVAAATE